MDSTGPREPWATVNISLHYDDEKSFPPLNDLLAAIYLIFFALIAGGAFALMNQNLRGSASLASGQTRGSRPRRHPEAPEPGDEVLYVDLSRERLEELYQQAS
jgi:hypothetical protein